jgi:hypothetical protein
MGFELRRESLEIQEKRREKKNESKYFVPKAVDM